jgi:hypothetical protein
MAKGQQRSNREPKKPKKEKPKNNVPATRASGAGTPGMHPKGEGQKR